MNRRSTTFTRVCMTLAVGMSLMHSHQRAWAQAPAPNAPEPPTLVPPTVSEVTGNDTPLPESIAPAYQSAVDLAIDEFARGNYPEARSAFGEAHRLYPNARTLRGIGMAEYELKNYVAAIDALERSLAANERPLTPELRASTETLLGRARGYVASYTIVLVPAHAQLVLDGSPVERMADRSIVVPVGDHVLEVHATGYHSERRTLQVTGRINQRIEIALSPLPPEPVAAQAMAPAASEPIMQTTAPASKQEPLVRKWWLWTGVGGVVAAGVLTAVLVSRDPGHAEPSGGTTGVVVPVPRAGASLR